MPMSQNRDSRNKSTQLQSIEFNKGAKNRQWEKGVGSAGSHSSVGLGEIGPGADWNGPSYTNAEFNQNRLKTQAWDLICKITLIKRKRA